MPNDLKLYTAATLDALSAEAARLPRRRKNLNVHSVLEDPVQRLFNALEPGTYARPHRHARDNGWELMIVIRGAFSVLHFDDMGHIFARADLRADDGDRAVEIPAYAWHSVVSLAPGTLMFEIKTGPYSPIEDKDFAVWAPPEGDPRASNWVRWFETAKPGDPAPASSDPP